MSVRFERMNNRIQRMITVFTQFLAEKSRVFVLKIPYFVVR